MVAKKQSLADFAKQFERIDCVACVLPEREEFDSALRAGVQRKIVLRWLWEVGGYGDKSVFDEAGKPTGISATMLDKHVTGQHYYKKES